MVHEKVKKYYCGSCRPPFLTMTMTEHKRHLKTAKHMRAADAAVTAAAAEGVAAARTRAQLQIDPQDDAPAAN